MVNSLLNHCGLVSLPFSISERTAVNRIVRAVHQDHPELFYVDFWRFERKGCIARPRSTVSFRLLMNRARANAVQNTINNRICQISSCIEKGHSLESKYYAIIRQIASSVSYCDTNSAFWNHTAAGPVLCHTAVCEGISKLFLLICQRVNLPCALCSGNLHNVPHSWNMVELSNNEIRYIDVTGMLRVATVFASCPRIVFKNELSLQRDGYLLDEW